jgi:hypothetical protein
MLGFRMAAGAIVLKLSQQEDKRYEAKRPWSLLLNLLGVRLISCIHLFFFNVVCYFSVFVSH